MLPSKSGSEIVGPPYATAAISLLEKRLHVDGDRTGEDHAVTARYDGVGRWP